MITKIGLQLYLLELTYLKLIKQLLATSSRSDHVTVITPFKKGYGHQIETAGSVKDTN